MQCPDCTYTDRNLHRFQAHTCTPPSSNYCEDYPCCGHELGDCYGLKYGTDDDLRAHAEMVMRLEDRGIFVPEFYW